MAIESSRLDYAHRQTTRFFGGWVYMRIFLLDLFHQKRSVFWVGFSHF